MDHNNILGAVLAGGKSQRFGEDKSQVNLEKHWKDFIEIFDKKNLSRKECLLLPLRTIAKALKI